MEPDARLPRHRYTRKGTNRTYSIQAAIAACHARAHRYAETDWETISLLYDRLALLTPSPIIELNRAVAVSMANGPAEGLAIVDTLIDQQVLTDYYLLPSVRGDLLSRLGRSEKARIEFQRAAPLTRNEKPRTLLLTRSHNAGVGHSQQ